MEEKVIGILGGMGPEATLNLFKKIIIIFLGFIGAYLVFKQFL